MTDVTTEQWEWDENTGEIRRVGSDEWLDFTQEPQGRLAAAAPEMARILRDILLNYECGGRADARISAVLKKAGVILP